MVIKSFVDSSTDNKWRETNDHEWLIFLNTDNLIYPIQLVRITISGEGDEATQHKKAVRTGLNSRTCVISRNVGRTCIGAPKFIFKAGDIIGREVKNDVLTIQETPAQIETPVRQHFFTIKNGRIWIIVHSWRRILKIHSGIRANAPNPMFIYHR